MSRHKSKSERSSRRKRSRSRRRKSYSTEEESEEVDTDDYTEETSSKTITTTEVSTPRLRNRNTRHKSSNHGKKRRHSTEEESSPRERKSKRDKYIGKKKPEPKRKVCETDVNETKLNTNRMIAIQSPAVDIYEHLISITTSATDTSEIHPPPKVNKAQEKKKAEKKRSEKNTSKRRNSHDRSSTRSKRRSSFDRSSSKCRSSHDTKSSTKRHNSSKLSPRSKPPKKSKTKKICESKHVKPVVDLPSCSLCTRSYGCPILLSCGHTFCKECISSFVETSDGKSFRCPTCAAKVDLKGSDEELFCPNFAILHQIEVNKAEADYICSVCESENEADHYCENCADLLCEHCVGAHEIVKYTKEHVIKRIKPNTDMTKYTKKKYFCAKHDGEILDIFCTSCQQPVCRICVLRLHTGNDHKCIPIKNAVKLCRDELKRRSFSHTSKVPSLHLALLDVKRLKKTLKEQVNTVHADVSGSIKRLVTKLKDTERDLHRKVDDVYNSKLNRIKTKKGTIKTNIEKFQAVNRLLSELEKHENEVELLQMKGTIEGTLKELEKCDQDLKLEKETFLLKSNEQKIFNEIEKHGQIFRVENSTSPKKEVKPVTRIPSCSYPTKSCNAVLISDFEDNVSSATGSIRGLGDIVNKKTSVAKARSLRARANWLIIRSRLKDIIKFGYSRGYDVRRPKLRNQKELFSNRLRRTKAKNLKAKAGWLIIKGNLQQVAQQKPPPKLARPRIQARDVTNIWVAQTKRRKNPQRMRTVAIKDRAKANWLLVRSRVRDIVDYGRVTGRISFGLMQVVLPGMYRRNRESKTISRLKRYRAVCLRARANWLLVNSRLKDIARYNVKGIQKKDVNKVKTWNDYRKDLLNNRDRAAQNKQMAGSIRAHANWLIVRTRIPDIILYGMYQQYESNRDQPDGGRERLQKQFEHAQSMEPTSPQKRITIISPPRSRSTSPIYAQVDKPRNKGRSRSASPDKRYDQPRPSSPSKFNWDKWDEMTGAKPREQRSDGKPPRPSSRSKSAKDNWNNLISRTRPVAKSKSVEDLSRADHGYHGQLDFDSTPTRRQLAMNNWELLQENMSNLNKTKSRSDDSIDRKEKAAEKALKQWGSTLGHLKKPAKAKEKSFDWDKTSDVSSTTRQSEEALASWDKLLQSTHVSAPVKTKPKKESKQTSILKPQVKRDEISMKQRDQIAERGWDVLISGTDTQIYDKKRAKENWRKVKISLGKGRERNSVEDIEKKWDLLIAKTKPDKIKKSPKKKSHHKNNIDEAYKNWHRLVNSINVTNEMLALKHWNALVSGTESEHEPQVEKHERKQSKIKEVEAVSKASNHEDSVDGKHSTSHKHWDALVSGTSGTEGDDDDEDDDDDDNDEAQKNWSHLINSTDLDESIDDNDNDNDDDGGSDEGKQEALQHWDKLIKSGPANNDQKQAYYHWDKLIEGRIVKQRKESKKEKQIDRDWDVLVATDNTVKSQPQSNQRARSPSPSKTSKSSVTSSAFKNWHKLLKTPPLPRKKSKADNKENETNEDKNEAARQNWNALISGDSMGSRENLPFDNWDMLLKDDVYESHNSEKPDGVNKLYDKDQNTLRKSENKQLSLKIRDSKGEFHNVNLKLSSPDRSILSAHVAENNDGTFTIFCCPRIDNDFNMYVSLSGDKFKHEIKVMNVYGSFAGLRKHETDLACRTISLLRWHLTPGLLMKKGDKVVARKGSIK